MGWLVPFGTPLVLVLDQGQEVTTAAIDLARIGYGVIGVLRAVEGWEDGGLTLQSHETATTDRLVEALEEGGQVIDVRDPSEWEAEHLPGSTHRYVPDLVDHMSDLDRSRPVWLVCSTGFRASIAASLLQREGLEPIVVTGGGVSETLAKLERDRSGLIWNRCRSGDPASRAYPRTQAPSPVMTTTARIGQPTMGTKGIATTSGAATRKW